MTQPKVTVWLSTYNQAPYVAQALDSILMQKTEFPFELVAADDCSTDDTQKIILEYQAKYPDKIVTYFTNPNVGGCRKLCDCIDKGLFRGDYLAYLEGDDYWLGEDRLQTLVDFLENHPEYSRVSHRRKIIDEHGRDKGIDTAEEVLNRPFYIDNLLRGQLYSDFGSVFRNYFREVGNRYHPLLLASRNVCDFQDMFITQDFGPVYVMDRVFGVYRSRSVAGATNYNSVTSQAARCRENIRLARAVENFYDGKYDLSPMIRHNEKRMFVEAVQKQDPELLEEVRQLASPRFFRMLSAEQMYFSKRGCRSGEIRFLNEALSPREARTMPVYDFLFRAKRGLWKLFRCQPKENRRGRVRRVR